MSKQIPLTQGKFAIVDDEDYEWLSQHGWHTTKDRKTYYAVRWSSKKGGRRNHRIWMHREIMKPLANMQIDHVNHNGLDNRKKNLRICTHSDNQHNRKPQPGKSSKHKGVTWHQKGWQVAITHNGKSIYIGRFHNELEAAKAYDAKAKELFGGFAKTNF